MAHRVRLWLVCVCGGCKWRCHSDLAACGASSLALSHHCTAKYSDRSDIISTWISSLCVSDHTKTKIWAKHSGFFFSYVWEIQMNKHIPVCRLVLIKSPALWNVIKLSANTELAFCSFLVVQWQPLSAELLCTIKPHKQVQGESLSLEPFHFLTLTQKWSLSTFNNNVENIKKRYKVHVQALKSNVLRLFLVRKGTSIEHFSEATVSLSSCMS